MPRGAGGELPSTLTGAAVAVADKLDTLVGIFGIGMLPTGSRTPMHCAALPSACCASSSSSWT